MKPIEFKNYVEDINGISFDITFLEEAKQKTEEFGYSQLEVIFNNNNLIGLNNIFQNQKYILGMKISFDNLPDYVSFIVKETAIEPNYKEMYFELKNKLSELIWKYGV